MQKKTTIIVCGALAALFYYSCSMPDILPKKVHIAGSPKIDLPVTTGSIDFNKAIDDQFRKDMPDGLDLYDAVNYTVDNEKTQAFLLRYEIIKQPLDPGKYLNQYDDAMGKVNNFPVLLDPIDESFEVPNFALAGGSTTPTDVKVGLAKMFEAIEQAATFSATIPFQIIPATLSTTVSDPSLFAIPLSSFTSLTFKSGRLKIAISVPNKTQFPTGFTMDITPKLQSPAITGQNFAGNADGVIALRDNMDPISGVSYFNLAGETIPNTLTLNFDLDMVYNSVIGTPIDILITIGWESGLDPADPNKVRVKAAEGLKLDTIETELGTADAPMPPIDFGNNMTNSGFLHAKIKTGELTLGIPNMPSKSAASPPADTDTWFKDFDLIYDISLSQPSLSFNDHGIAGVSSPFVYPGLNGNSTSHRIQFTDVGGTGSTQTHNLGETSPGLSNGCDINKNSIGLSTSPSEKSKIIIKADPTLGLSFNLSDGPGGDLTNGYIMLKVQQNVAISEISEAHVDIGTQIPLPAIAPIKLEGVGDYLRWIKFAGNTAGPGVWDDCIGLEFNIDALDPPSLTPPPAGHRLDNKLDMILELKDFMYDNADGTEGTTPLVIKQTLAQGSNEFKNDKPVTLNIQRIAQAQQDVYLNFDVSLKAKEDIPNKSGGNVLRLENIAPGDTLVFKTPGVKGGAKRDDIIIPHFKWTKALVSLGTTGNINDQYPLKTADPPKLDLKDMVGGYMKGFGLQGAKAGVYISGPQDLVNKIEPNLSFAAKYNLKIDPVTSAPVLDSDNEPVYDSALPLLPANYKLNVLSAPVSVPLINGKHIYNDIVLPPGGTEVALSTINQLMADLPSDLIFGYKLWMDELEVTPDKFTGVSRTSSDLAVEVMLLLPLQFAASDQGAEVTLPGMFDENKDLFGREKADEFNKYLNVGSAYVNVEFNSVIFSGATLFLDKNGKVFPKGIPLGGKSINLALGKSDLEAFRNNLLIPEIKMVFPPKATIKIPRDIGLAKISFGVSDFNFDFDLPENWLGK